MNFSGEFRVKKVGSFTIAETFGSGAFRTVSRGTYQNSEVDIKKIHIGHLDLSSVVK
jgi:hypothetical protein